MSSIFLASVPNSILGEGNFSFFYKCRCPLNPSVNYYWVQISLLSRESGYLACWLMAQDRVKQTSLLKMRPQTWECIILQYSIGPNCHNLRFNRRRNRFYILMDETLRKFQIPIFHQSKCMNGHPLHSSRDNRGSLELKAGGDSAR